MELRGGSLLCLVSLRRVRSRYTPRRPPAERIKPRLRIGPAGPGFCPSDYKLRLTVFVLRELIGNTACRYLEFHLETLLHDDSELSCLASPRVVGSPWSRIVERKTDGKIYFNPN